MSLLISAIVLAAFTAMGFPRQVIAQDQSSTSQITNNVRYKVVFTGTFGGPNGHIGILGLHVLNSDGTLIGSADTSQPDPFAPDGCFNGDDCFATHAFEQRNGKMIDLGTLPGGGSSETNWITPNGLISGNSQNGLVDPNTGWGMHGVLWKHGKIIDLGTLEGGPLSVTSAVNSSAEVVGLSLNRVQDAYSIWGFYQTRAFRWKDGVLMDLGTLGGPDAVASRINEKGQIAGNSYVGLTPTDACPPFRLVTGAFLWDKGHMIDLGNLGGSCTVADDLNNQGEVVGYSLLAGDQGQHPFLWKDGSLSDLGTLGGNYAEALAINDAGDVVGWQTLPNDDGLHATLWSKGQITDLGALPGDKCSLASSLNLRGQVVGLSSLDCSFQDPTLRAFISERGQRVVDLNTLIPPDSGVELRNAMFINDRGEIAAVGSFPDGHHGPVLLVPMR